MRRRIVALAALAALGTAGLLGGCRGDAATDEAAQGYTLRPSFTEDFGEDRLDTARWCQAFCDGPGMPTVSKRSLWGNKELEVYLEPGLLGLGIAPNRVAGGLLTITAAPLPPEALAVVRDAIAAQPPAIRNSALRDVAYGSGMISSRRSFAQLYGYFEVRARWSAGKGLWPAFWLLPADGSWPPEIDAMEAHGDKPGIAFQSIHARGLDITRKVAVPGDPAAFHRYGVLWTPRTITWSVDGVETAELPTPESMNKPMFLIANLAVGGAWPGNPEGTKFPATMTIDYIRAWRLVPAPSSAAVPDSQAPSAR